MYIFYENNENNNNKLNSIYSNPVGLRANIYIVVTIFSRLKSHSAAGIFHISIIPSEPSYRYTWYRARRGAVFVFYIYSHD